MPDLKVLLISTYELGRQPFGLASPAAWLRADGFYTTSLDLSRQSLDEEAVRTASLIAFYLPMHAATRIAVRALERGRKLNPSAHLCGFGLYAPVNAGLLRRLGVGTILGGEFEQGLLSLARRLEAGAPGPGLPQVEPEISLARQNFLVPYRGDLPPLEKYAHLTLPDDSTRVVGYTEASRGCKHLCRHCPIVPVYKGTFRIVQREVVLEDIRLCSAKSRCDLTQQFPRSNIHGAARREHLALVSGKWLATHADGSLGAAAACCRNPECLAPSSHEVVPDCSGQPTPA